MIWAPDGTVLAQSRQLGIIMPTDKPVLQPAALADEQDAELTAGQHRRFPTTRKPTVCRQADTTTTNPTRQENP